MSSSLKVVQEGGGCSRTPALNIERDGSGLGPEVFMGRAAVITLGCAKNQVDSEVMLGVLRKNGYEIVTELETADVAVVNTCSFLESAVKESIDSILNVAEYKERGRLRKLIVAGCLVERYRDELKKTIPEVDSFISVDDILKVGEAAGAAFGSELAGAARPYFLYDDTMPRYLSTRSHTAYVKVSEGCNRPCTFCIIPKIRGAMRSRSIDSVAREVRELGAQGVKEVNLVAQDLTSFGKDHKNGDLTALLKRLDGDGAVPWIRLLYAYPIGIDAALLDAITGSQNVCRYLDLPLQHASEAVLKRMQRPVGRYSPRSIIEFIRGHAPEIKLRTTFIVGFPGETESDVRELEDFIAAGHFSSVGIFTYSPEPGTPAHDMADQIDAAEKDARRERLMLAQQRVNEQTLEALVGTAVEVLVEGEHEETDLLLTGRTRFQAPEVDGTVIINDIEGADVGSVQPGTIGSVEITEVAGYDLVGTFRANAREGSAD